MHKKLPKIPAFIKIILALAVFSALLSLICLFPAVCDWYTDHIYGTLSGAVGRISGLIPFPVMETADMLEYPALILCGVILLLLIFLRKKKPYRTFCTIWFKAAAVFVVCQQFAGLLLSVVPEHGNVLGKAPDGQKTNFSMQEMHALYCDILRGLNAAAEEIEIAEDGSAAFPSNAELTPQIQSAVQSLAAAYPRLSGYCPPFKQPLDSDALERMGIGGITYSVTQEIVMNKYLFPTDYPVTAAHELAHAKGFCKEDEANFISEIALSKSDNPYLRFSAYLRMLSYTEPKYNEVYDAFTAELTAAGTLRPQEPFRSDMTPEEKQQFFDTLQANDTILTAILGQPAPERSNRSEYIEDAAMGIAAEKFLAEAAPETKRSFSDPELSEQIAAERETHWTEYKEAHQDHYYDGVVLLLLQYHHENGECK